MLSVPKELFGSLVPKDLLKHKEDFEANLLKPFVLGGTGQSAVLGASIGSAPGFHFSKTTSEIHTSQFSSGSVKDWFGGIL